MVIMILSSSLLIVMILLFRQLFRRRVRAGFIYAMWGLAALRLLIPISLIEVPLPSLFADEYVNVSQNPNKEPESEQGQLAEEKAEAEDGQTEYDYLTKYDYVYQAGEEIPHEAVEYGTESAVPGSVQAEYDYQTYSSEGIPGTDSNAENEKTSDLPGKQMQGDNDADGGKGRLFTKEQAVRLMKGVWLSVSALLFFVIVVSNWRMYLRLKRSRVRVRTERRPYIYKSELVSVPCLYGLFRPAIYLTPQAAGETEETLNLIICHERMHYRHRDYLWAALRIFLVCLYWFHPLVWVAAKISRRDAEYAADEAVIRDMEEEERYCYGESILHTLRSDGKKRGLLSMASTACSSKREIKKRMIFISETKKYSVISIVLMMIVAGTVTACSFVGKAGQEPGIDASEESLNQTMDEETGISMPEELDTAVRDVIRNGTELPAEQDQTGETVLTEAYVPLAVEEIGKQTKVYFIALAVQYGIQEVFGFTGLCSESQTSVITFEKKNGKYQVVDNWTVKGDAETEETAVQVRKNFPDRIPDEKLDRTYWTNLLTARCHVPAMQKLMKEKEKPGNEPGHAPIGSAEMISIYAGDSFVGEYGLEAEANRKFMDKLVDAYNRMELQTVTEDSGISMEISSAVTICFWSEWKKLVQITFDENGVCWINGEPLIYQMKENVFPYDDIVTFVEKQSRKRLIYHPMIASDIPDIVDWDNDRKLLRQLLDSGDTIDGALIKKRAEQMSGTEGLPFEDVYAAQRDMFVQLKRNRLAAGKKDVALTRKECSLKGVREGIAGTEAEKTLKQYCEMRGISSKQYWEYMEMMSRCLFPYEKYERKIFREDDEFQREFKGQYKSFEDAAGLMEEYYKPQIDKMIRSIPVTVTAPEKSEKVLTERDKAVSQLIKEEMSMSAATDSSNRYVSADKWSFVESHVRLATENDGDTGKEYIVRKAACYGIKKKTKGFEELGFKQGYCILTLKEKDGKYELTDWWESGDPKEIRRQFPDSVKDEQLDIKFYQGMLDGQCAKQKKSLKE